MHKLYIYRIQVEEVSVQLGISEQQSQRPVDQAAGTLLWAGRYGWAWTGMPVAGNNGAWPSNGGAEGGGDLWTVTMIQHK